MQQRFISSTGGLDQGQRAGKALFGCRYFNLVFVLTVVKWVNFFATAPTTQYEQVKFPSKLMHSSIVKEL